MCVSIHSIGSFEMNSIFEKEFTFAFTVRKPSILMAGGYTYGTGDEPTKDITSVQVISNTQHNYSLPNLPYAMTERPVMFIHSQEDIIVCGGNQAKTKKNSERNCLKLERGQLVQHSMLKRERTESSIVTIQKGTFIFGGYCSPYTYEYLLHNSRKWTLGKTQIPDGYFAGSTVAISEEEIYLIGGNIPDDLDE